MRILASLNPAEAARDSACQFLRHCLEYSGNLSEIYRYTSAASNLIHLEMNENILYTRT